MSYTFYIPNTQNPTIKAIVDLLKTIDGVKYETTEELINTDEITKEHQELVSKRRKTDVKKYISIDSLDNDIQLMK